MYIRSYRPEDCSAVLQLFFQTVHTVNAKDYTPQQLDAWADGKEDPVLWNLSLSQHNCLVAISDGILVGFADMDATGYLDRLYVHKDYQRHVIIWRPTPPVTASPLPLPLRQSRFLRRGATGSYVSSR